MNGFFKFVAIVSVLCFGVSAGGDILELVDGSIHLGRVVGYSEDTIDFEYSRGGITTFWIYDVLSVRFVEAPRVPDDFIYRRQIPVFQTGYIAGLPAGTPLSVQMVDPVSSRIHGAGYIFTAILLNNLTSEGYVLAGPGTIVTGRMRRISVPGRVSLSLELTSITTGGIVYPIKAGYVRVIGDRRGTRTGRVRRAGRRPSAFRTGQAVSSYGPVITTGTRVHVPAGTLLEFRLSEDYDYIR